MKRTLCLALALAVSAGFAMAQTNQQGNPAVKNPQANSGSKPGQLEPGSNSFTEGQAKSKIEEAGYRNVTELKKDDQGIWRGKAQKDGKSVSVGLDFKGNVAQQ